MGVCRFFQQGNCRFGTKCHNEHFNVKQYLKTDIESCLNGKMWPFSVYGPFKDKPNVPNYIDDQSFEEVRYQAYESQRLNCFDQFHQQFTKQLHETTNKMQIMLQCSPQVLDVMIKLYEAPEGVKATANNRNPFSFNGNCGQAGSIFNKPTSTSSNIFNNSADTTKGFASTGKSIFGGSSMTGNNTGNNIFGGSTSTNFFVQQQQLQPSTFGQQQHQSSIFGQGLPQQQMNAIGHVQPHNLLVSSSNNFLSQTQPPNITTFAQGFALQRGQPATQQPSTIFVQTASTTTSPNTGNIFAQTAQQTSTELFGSFHKTHQQEVQPEAMQQVHPLMQQIIKPEANTSIYSRMEDLSHEEIAAFNAEQFTPGQVPFNPPPREMC